MDLDKAINAARQEAQQRATQAQQQLEYEQRQRDEEKALLTEAVMHLQSYGNEKLIRIQSAKWFHLGEIYFNSQKARYRTTEVQRCWILSSISGRNEEGGPWMESPILLLADATVGRFWLDPDLEPKRQGEYVTSSDPTPARECSLFMKNGDYRNTLKRSLAEAIVRYERQT